ncbi:MAG: tyrosine-type recombinase/integrase [Pseudonocardiaceae bacterium]
MRLHDLRHGAASLSLAAGNDLKTVQTMLGHSSIVLTADTYTSVLPDLAHHAAEATARLILTSAGTTSRALRNGHPTSHNRPARRPARLTIPPQRSTLPSRH